MSDETALIPVEQREIDFYEDQITAVLVEEEDGGRREVYIPIRPLVDYLGLAWTGQYERIQRDPVLSDIIATVRVTRTEGKREVTRGLMALPLGYLNGWLFGINANRVKEETRDRLIRYQRECYQVLADAFLGPQETTVTSATASLIQVRDMGLAIARLAEEQIQHERRLTTVEGRLDQAAIVVGRIDKRLRSVEKRVSPGNPISDEQAAEIKELVKAVAMAHGGNFQAIWGEMHRRFEVSSYKLIPQEKFADVLRFLKEWGGKTE
jgi:hypothetical protein